MMRDGEFRGLGWGGAIGCASYKVQSTLVYLNGVALPLPFGLRQLDLRLNLSLNLVSLTHLTSHSTPAGLGLKVVVPRDNSGLR